MACEGLNDPVTVVEAPGDRGEFLLRKGFRRTTAARSLGWREIPAIILPKDTPVVEEHWINIIENTARSNLSTYEVANACESHAGRLRREPLGFRCAGRIQGLLRLETASLPRQVARRDHRAVASQSSHSRRPPCRVDGAVSGGPPSSSSTSSPRNAARARSNTCRLPRERIKNSPLMTATNFWPQRMQRGAVRHRGGAESR